MLAQAAGAAVAADAGAAGAASTTGAAGAAGAGTAAGSGGSAAATSGLAAIPGVAVGAGLIAGGAIIASRSGSAAPTAPAEPQDSVAPGLVSTAVSSTSGTITLTFNEALDSKGTLRPADFEVKVNGEAITASLVTISGNTVVLKFDAIPAGNINLSIAYTDAAAGRPVKIGRAHV